MIPASTPATGTIAHSIGKRRIDAPRPYTPVILMGLERLLLGRRRAWNRPLNIPKRNCIRNSNRVRPFPFSLPAITKHTARGGHLYRRGVSSLHWLGEWECLGPLGPGRRGGPLWWPSSRRGCDALEWSTWRSFNAWKRGGFVLCRVLEGLGDSFKGFCVRCWGGRGSGDPWWRSRVALPALETFHWRRWDRRSGSRCWYQDFGLGGRWFLLRRLYSFCLQLWCCCYCCTRLWLLGLSCRCIWGLNIISRLRSCCWHQRLK
jgi:hypothetical protein